MVYYATAKTLCGQNRDYQFNGFYSDFVYQLFNFVQTMIGQMYKFNLQNSV